MKTLYLSIIVISLIGISFLIGENAYACLGNCPPIPTPPHYDSPTITVNTNLENYTTTDKLIISSHVFNPSNKIPLVIKIFNPNRDLESVKIFPLSSNESYTWIISPPIDFYYSGNYTVLSQFGEYYAVSHFYLNSTITQYYLSQAPLKQFRMGTFAQDVHCHTGLQLFFKAEDYTPACAQSETATVLIQRGWAMAHLPESFIAKFAITGLQQNYPAGQPINATVTYSGYYWYAEPEVRILDANGTQIWFNCPYCYTRTELAQLPSSHTFTYIVRDYASNKLPVINKTGTYTMIASLHNKTASAEFTIVKPSIPNGITGLENDTGIVTFENRAYYFETPHYTQDAYVNPTQISFHGVVFTLFPSGYRGGLPIPCSTQGSDQYYWTDAKFADDSHELLHILVDDPPCINPIPSMFSNHTNPQAGLTFYDKKMKLLVSMEGVLQQNDSVFSTTIPTNETIYHDFPNPPEYSIIDATQGIAVSDDTEASNLTGFSVKSPTDLPPGYKVKLIKTSKEIPMVTIFVSKYPLTENTTSEDFLWNQQGILITYQHTGPHEFENFKHFWGASTNKTITIAGTPAEVFDISKEYHDGYPYDVWGSLLAIQDNVTSIGIDGFFNSDDLIKIATSMLEK